jgi:Flp pilus assembly protein TadG
MRRFTFATRRPTRRHREQSGASAVEFALVSPVLIMLVFGIMAFGILLAQKLALGNAAREAARFGVVGERTCGQIRTAAQDAATTIGMTGTNATVTIKVGSTQATSVNKCPSGSDAVKPCAGSADGSIAYVQIDYTSRLVIPLVIAKNSFPINGAGVFRCEFS